MNHKLLLFFLFFPIFLFGQVGINTLTPMSTLHVNGSLQLTNDLKLGGTDNTVGNSGSQGQVLTSSGEGKPPVWSDIEEGGITTNSSVLRLSAVALRNTVSSNNSANSFTVIEFQQVPKINTAEITYDPDTGEFTFKRAGYYQVTLSSELDMSSNASGQTSGTAQSLLTKNDVSFAMSTSGHQERTNNVYHTTVGVTRFEVGDVLAAKMTIQRIYKIGDLNSITISFISD